MKYLLLLLIIPLLGYTEPCKDRIIIIENTLKEIRGDLKDKENILDMLYMEYTDCNDSFCRIIILDSILVVEEEINNIKNLIIQLQNESNNLECE